MQIAAHPHICTIMHFAAELVLQQSTRTAVSLLLFVRLSYEESYWAVITRHPSIGTVQTGSCWEHCLLSEMHRRILPWMRSGCARADLFPSEIRSRLGRSPTAPPACPATATPPAGKSMTTAGVLPSKVTLLCFTLACKIHTDSCRGSLTRPAKHTCSAKAHTALPPWLLLKRIWYGS